MSLSGGNFHPCEHGGVIVQLEVDVFRLADDRGAASGDRRGCASFHPHAYCRRCSRWRIATPSTLFFLLLDRPLVVPPPSSVAAVSGRASGGSVATATTAVDNVGIRTPRPSGIVPACKNSKADCVF